MSCNYDLWKTPVPTNVTPKMIDILQVMKDGKERRRVAMLWAAGYDPNPTYIDGHGGFEKYDYFLYKKGLIEVVRMEGQQKIFRITEAGLKAIGA